MEQSKKGESMNVLIQENKDEHIHSPREFYEELCQYCRDREIAEIDYETADFLYLHGYSIKQAEHFINTKYEKI